MTEMTNTPIENTDDTAETLSNQTQFGSEEPLFEHASLPTPPSEKNAQPAGPKKFWQDKVFLFGVGVVGVSLLLLMMIGMSSPRRVQQLLGQNPTPSPRPAQSALQQRLNEVKTDLSAADPSQSDLPFPPVDKNIYLDKPAQ